MRHNTFLNVLLEIIICLLKRYLASSPFKTFLLKYWIFPCNSQRLTYLSQSKLKTDVSLFLVLLSQNEITVFFECTCLYDIIFFAMFCNQIGLIDLTIWEIITCVLIVGMMKIWHLPEVALELIFMSCLPFSVQFSSDTLYIIIIYPIIIITIKTSS